MSNTKPAGRTFLTKEEIAQRDELIKDSNLLDQQFNTIGQLVTTLFIQLDETKAKTIEVRKIHTDLTNHIKETYGDVTLTEEGEVVYKEPTSETPADEVEELPTEEV